MSIKQAIERIEGLICLSRYSTMMKADVLQILCEEAEREVVSIAKCKEAVASLYTNWESYEKRVPNHTEIITAILTAAGVKFKE